MDPFPVGSTLYWYPNQNSGLLYLWVVLVSYGAFRHSTDIIHCLIWKVTLINLFLVGPILYCCPNQNSVCDVFMCRTSIF